MFVVFEGIDGSGKSTQIELVEKLLKDKGFRVWTTKEPTNGYLGKLAKEALNDPSKSDFEVSVLMAADRALHVQEIDKKESDNYIILCDRYIFSNYAYQYKVGIENIENLNKFAISNAAPDLVVYFDITVEEAMKRINGRREKNTENVENADFLYDVRKRYFISPNYNFLKVNSLDDKYEIAQKIYISIIDNIKDSKKYKIREEDKVNERK